MIKEIQTLHLINYNQNIECIMKKKWREKDIKSQENANLLNSRFDLNLRNRTGKRYLNEIEYKYDGYKIKKNIDDQEIKLNWFNRHVFDNCNIIFFVDETTIYLNNQGGLNGSKKIYIKML